MTIKWCKNCGRIKWNDHKCPPKWKVREEDFHDKDEWISIFAHDETSAAEFYAERADREGDYTFINGSDAEVWVKKPDSPVIFKFNISAESIPTYRANEV